MPQSISVFIQFLFIMEHIFNNKFPYFVFDKQIFIQHYNQNISKIFDLIEPCLGEGGYAKVYKAIQTNLNKKQQSQSDTHCESAKNIQFSDQQMKYQKQRLTLLQRRSKLQKLQQRAIKKVNIKKVKDQDMLKQQIKIMTYLDHPRVAKLYDSYIFKQSLYLVQEYNFFYSSLLGSTLFDQFEKVGKITQQEAKTVFRQMIQATQYLHSKFLCHRDFKMENFLFLNPNEQQSPPTETSPFMGRIVLIDFGLSFCWQKDMRKQIRASCQKNKIVGTSYYIAPQILQHSYDQRCDIWSLGVILYALLSGKPFIDGKNDDQILKNIKKLKSSQFFKKNKYFNHQIFQNGSQFSQEMSSQARDLLNKILQPQQIRLNLQQIKNHPWLKNSQDTEKLQQSNQESTQKNQNQSKKAILMDIFTPQLINQYNSLNELQKMQCLYFSTRIPLNSICAESLDVKYQQVLRFMKEVQIKNSIKHKQSYCSYKSLDTNYTSQKYDSEFEESQADKPVHPRDHFRQQKFTIQNQIHKVKLSSSLNQQLPFSQFLAYYIFARAKNNKKIIDDIPFCQAFSDKNLKKTFNIYDTDKDGFISTKDFMTFFKENGIQKQNMPRIKHLMQRYLLQNKMSFQQYKSVVQLKNVEKDSSSEKSLWLSVTQRCDQFDI